MEIPIIGGRPKGPKRLPRYKVLVTVPNMGWIRKEVVEAVWGCMDYGHHDIHVDLIQGVPLEGSQSKVINRIRKERFDYWVSMDDDTVPSKNPLELIQYNLDIIGLPYPCWVKKGDLQYLHYAAYIWNEEVKAYQHAQPPAEGGIQEVDAIGGGAFVIKGTVFDNPELQHGAFLRTWNDDGTVAMGNDMSFCKRAKAAGFRLFTHWDFISSHIKEVDLHAQMQIFQNLQDGLHAEYGKRIKELQAELAGLRDGSVPEGCEPAVAQPA